MNIKYKSLENQFIYPSPKGSKLILAAPSSTTSGVRFFAPHGVGVNEEPERSSTKSKSMDLYVRFPIFILYYSIFI